MTAADVDGRVDVESAQSATLGFNERVSRLVSSARRVEHQRLGYGSERIERI
jgi:hypothetical protein